MDRRRQDSNKEEDGEENYGETEKEDIARRLRRNFKERNELMRKLKQNLAVN